MSDVHLPVYSDPIKTAPGFFKVRLMKDGPWVPAKLWRIEERDEAGDLMSDVQYRASIDQDEVPANDPPRWPWVRIEESEYQFMVDLAAWSRAHDPDSAPANPRRPIKQSTAEFY